MATDVFTGIPLEKHTGGGPMTVEELRAKYGPDLTFSATATKRKVVRGWERSQVQVIVLHFQDNNGTPVPGIQGNYFWPDSPPDGVPVTSNGDGNIDWAFSGDSFYDPRTERGPYTFKGDGITFSGMGSPSKNMPVNHDSMSFDIVVNPADPVDPPTEPPSGGDIDTAYIETQLGVIEQAVVNIRAAIS